MTTIPRRLGHLLGAEHSVSLATVADLLRLATRLRSRKSIADWCEALADELDRFEEDDPMQEVSARMNLQRNLHLRRPAASLLQALARAPKQMHRREDLCDLIGTTPGALKVYVWEIRNSFGALEFDDPLETVWGEGYILTEEGAAFVRRASRKILVLNGTAVGGGSVKRTSSKAAGI